MRIFYAVDQSPDAINIPDSRLWYNNLYLPLVDLGHEVVPFNYNLTPHFQNLNPAEPKQRIFIEKNRPKLERALLQQIEDAHRRKPVDIFFSYFYSACCRPEVIKEIGRMGICTINWYCNASYQFHLVEEIAPAYNYCLVPEKFRLDDYRRIGANPIYCQEAANPNIYKPYNLPRQYDVTFVGQKYGDRPEYIKYLAEADIKVRVWGNGWRIVSQSKPGPWKILKNTTRTALGITPRMQPPDPLGLPDEILGPPLADDELIKMYSRSKISLGFSSCGDTHLGEKRILQIRLRDFEAPMSGAFYMVEYMEELKEFFVPDKEIICYTGKEDLRDKVKYYLEHETEREHVRQAGYQRAIKEHTWQERFRKVFQTIGLH